MVHHVPGQRGWSGDSSHVHKRRLFREGDRPRPLWTHHGHHFKNVTKHVAVSSLDNLPSEALAGPIRGLQGIHQTCFVEVLKFKNHQLEVYNLLEDLMKTLHLVLSSSHLPGCPGQRVDEVVAANSHPRKALGRASGGESPAEQRRLEGGLGHASFCGGQFRNISFQAVVLECLL